ncbi:nicotinate phosphoribosyltransferase [Siphonobacter sp. SORGH_AS_1065]|uniref:nicotinate phosphoribosyltransferase n=1 Tax=Siphonobacter sp. SORGH_AS_1065 TaxID=3041795 RepID=UPI00278864BD|nr:nicotinate phosphoribosyltransferase [Siphonobacter sp. SORGH_AS_1065]MDQ1086954.1 nicotinamide phosphoribosyltransferase [Siphonobacter sp. SORGH_AS_1065]
MNPIHLSDGYKVDHRSQYPTDTELVYSNLTPRKSRLDGFDTVVFFGMQYFIKKYLMEEFNEQFFQKPKAEVLRKYQRRIENYLGKGAVTFDHIEALHDLGYLPLEIRALPEGTLTPFRVPMFTIQNTKPEFFWLTNFLETLLSCILWLPCTSATTAFHYRTLLEQYAAKTGGDTSFVPWQGHDFSFRGMAGLEAAEMSGAAHLLSFTGTDTIPAIDFLETYYLANVDRELVGGSVPATEHSVMCMGTQSGEIDTFKRLINDIYPQGVVSIVSDTWDFWQVITEFMPRLKRDIISRNGKVVIRPDSGDPVKILCGDPQAEPGTPEYKGAVECLWETFGGNITEKGFRLLDPHIGLIYGDSITLERCQTICQQLADKGFASTNIVFGIGSYTYQYVTRDTFGFAMKATYGVVKGEGRAIFKDPKTDDGTKRSAKGLMKVTGENGIVTGLVDQVSAEEAMTGLLETIYKNGQLLKEQSLQEIRLRLAKQREKQQLIQHDC